MLGLDHSFGERAVSRWSGRSERRQGSRQPAGPARFQQLSVSRAQTVRSRTPKRYARRTASGATAAAAERRLPRRLSVVTASATLCWARRSWRLRPCGVAGTRPLRCREERSNSRRHCSPVRHRDDGRLGDRAQYAWQFGNRWPLAAGGGNETTAFPIIAGVSLTHARAARRHRVFSEAGRRPVWHAVRPRAPALPSRRRSVLPSM